jgi:4-hydroxy-3-polyprenylbenzoate decarboxylase
MKPVIVGISGATGTIYGVRLLERLRDAGVETHLVITSDMGAAISSGSFQTAGMIIAPCSAKTLAAIAHGYGDNLIQRAADVVLKERRRLVLAVREAPLSEIHLENMLKLSRMGVVILPPMPAFYNHPLSLDDVVDHTVARLLDHVGIDVPGAQRWSGEMSVGGARRDED